MTFEVKVVVFHEVHQNFPAILLRIKKYMSLNCLPPCYTSSAAYRFGQAGTFRPGVRQGIVNICF